MKLSSSTARWLVGVGIAVVLVAGTAAFFTVEVCDEELAGERTVRVCRHLRGTDPPVIAVGVVVVAALGFFFSEISGFGISLKREVREAKETAQEAKQATTRWSETAADLKEEAADVKEGLAQALGGEPVGPAPEGRVEGTSSPFAELAGEYNRIRWTMTSGGERTAAMTSVVNRMIEVARGLESLDVGAHLDSDDRGLRLAGYAYLFARPDPAWAARLAESLLSREDKPFGQYWALRSLRRLVEADPDALDRNTTRRLREFLPQLSPGSDRASELRLLLDRVKG